MSDKLTGCPLDKLLQWILAEEKQGQIFGIRRELFFVPHPGDVFRMQRYGRLLETPLGVAAGPHTQLSQNIISAWLTGARYIELKTVQTLDDLDVTKPCIDMTDEGYNCEWSQELKLEQSFNEYLNAWIILHILRDKFGWAAAEQPGFIFNMSVGYNLEGILNANVQSFLDKMTDCRRQKAAKIETLAAIYPRVGKLAIADRISDNITVSTMHGCPPDEVEKIGRYFIEQRRLHTTIKFNPTLLGARRLRHILNDELGFEVQVPDAAFEHDLSYDAGVAVIQSLLASAARTGVRFSLKLTNTLETANSGRSLPASEKMLYMSGRALHPVTVNLARRLQREFEGRLDISFSGGCDCFNVADVLACNLRPVTVCSDILKPGGYGRLRQYLDEIARTLAAAGSASIPAFICARGGSRDLSKAGLKNLDAYAAAVREDEAYKKSRFPYENIKTPRELTVFDCAAAPCVATCPVGQDIPAYMYYTAQGDYRRAWEVILATNPFPNVQGMVCDHLCQLKCTRLNYDNPLLIREIKRFIARKNTGAAARRPAAANGRKAAIIGAGPSGLACAYFLALAGFSVEVYEAKDIAGGMAADAIPAFRLDDASLKTDIANIVALGVRIHYKSPVDHRRFEALRSSHDYVYIAAGAQKGLSLGIPGEDAPGVYDQLGFLSAVRRGHPPKLGKRVVVVGGGNAAMDAARTARRLVGPDGHVSVLYRRSRREMPADAAEIQAALAEGIELVELTAPECLLVEDGRVQTNVCFKMQLGEKDASGRRRPTKIEGSEFDIRVDSVISAIGQRVEVDFCPPEDLQADPDTLETRLPNVFAGGDAVRGAATLIKAIGDGKRTAEAIQRKAAGTVAAVASRAARAVDSVDLQIRQARRIFGPPAPETAPEQRLNFELVTQTLDDSTARQEARRCLQCDVMCNICTTVCPNRANIAYRLDPVQFTVQRVMASGGGVDIEDVETVRLTQRFQIINLADFCNECGNCTTFCPTSGAPYLIKPRFYLMRQSFEREADGYLLTSGVLEARVDGVRETLSRQSGSLVYETRQLRAHLDPGTLTVQEVQLAAAADGPIDLRHATRMGILLTALGDFYF